MSASATEAPKIGVLFVGAEARAARTGEGYEPNHPALIAITREDGIGAADGSGCGNRTRFLRDSLAAWPGRDGRGVSAKPCHRPSNSCAIERNAGPRSCAPQFLFLPDESGLSTTQSCPGKCEANPIVVGIVDSDVHCRMPRSSFYLEIHDRAPMLMPDGRLDRPLSDSKQVVAASGFEPPAHLVPSQVQSLMETW